MYLPISWNPFFYLSGHIYLVSNPINEFPLLLAIMNPTTQNAKAPRKQSKIFFIRIFVVFLALTLPASKNANPPWRKNIMKLLMRMKKVSTEALRSSYFSSNVMALAFVVFTTSGAKVVHRDLLTRGRIVELMMGMIVVSSKRSKLSPIRIPSAFSINKSESVE